MLKNCCVPGCEHLVDIDGLTIKLGSTIEALRTDVKCYDCSQGKPVPIHPQNKIVEVPRPPFDRVIETLENLQKWPEIREVGLQSELAEAHRLLLLSYGHYPERKK